MNTVNQAAEKERTRIKKTWKNTTLYSVFKQFMRKKTARIGLIILLILILLAVFADVIAPYDYTKIDPIHAREGISSAHWLGTDIYGRDILSRLLHGARYSLSLAFAAELSGMLLGVILGAIAGYFGGIADVLILRFCDILQSIPNTLLAICVSQVLGGGYLSTIIALSFGGVASMTRLLRGQMLNVRKMEYVEAAEVINCSKTRIMFSHIVPNCVSPLIITGSLGIGGKILTSSSLSYLGLGIQEPNPEWGAMISSGRQYFRTTPHLIVIPGIVICITVLAFNMIGDGLRDALDPKQRS